MKASLIRGWMLSLLFAPLVVSGARSEDTPSKPRFEVTEQVTDTLKILKIVKDTRTVSLRRSSGDTVEVVAGPEVRNFDQLKVGDRVVTKLSETMMIHVEEGGSPEIVKETTVGHAPVGSAPRGTKSERNQFKASIVSIDLENGTATLKGPDPEPFTITPADRTNLTRVKVGDLVVVTHTVTTAIWVEKPGAKKAAAPAKSAPPKSAAPTKK
jgi:hypothetical protein